MVEDGGHSAMHPALRAALVRATEEFKAVLRHVAMSLRVRLNLIITALIVLFTLVTGKIIVDDMRNSIREEIEAGTRSPCSC